MASGAFSKPTSISIIHPMHACIYGRMASYIWQPPTTGTPQARYRHITGTPPAHHRHTAGTPPARHREPSEPIPASPKGLSHSSPPQGPSHRRDLVQGGHLARRHPFHWVHAVAREAAAQKCTLLATACRGPGVYDAGRPGQGPGEGMRRVVWDRSHAACLHMVRQCTSRRLQASIMSATTSRGAKAGS